MPHFIFFLSATFYLMVRVCAASKPYVDTPPNLHWTIEKTWRRKSRKKNQKKKIQKKSNSTLKKILSQNRKKKKTNWKKLVRSESLKWCNKLRRSHSKMELHNINSHKMAINTHYIHERTIVLYSHSKEKKIEKKIFRKKI